MRFCSEKILLCVSFCAILLFTQNVSAQSWPQKGLSFEGPVDTDFLGSDVAINSDGNIVAIGSVGSGFTGGISVYEWTGTMWSQLGMETIGEGDDQFGSAIAMNAEGTSFIAGAYQNDGSGLNAGHVRVFEWDGMAWNQKGTDLDGEAAGDNFGISVDMSADGNTIVIGGNGNDGLASNSGHARVFDWDGNNWLQKGFDIDGEAINNSSGGAVGMSSGGDIIAIGAIGNQELGITAGHVRVYEWSGILWQQKGEDIDGEGDVDFFGESVALSADGNTLAVGASLNDGNATDAGHVRIFNWNGTNWQQIGNDIEGEVANDRSGISVDLSADGNIVGIGAPIHNVNGPATGYVRVFEWSGSEWIPIGNSINGQVGGDFFGNQLALSASGLTLIAGASMHDGAGFSRGQARVHISPTASSVAEYFPNPIKIYPNPSNGHFQIDVNSEPLSSSIRIYNLLGEVIYETTIESSNDLEIDLSDQPGTYLLELTNEKLQWGAVRVVII